MRTAVKAVRAATTKTAGEAALQAAVAILDRTAAKGIIKRGDREPPEVAPGEVRRQALRLTVIA